MAKIRVASFRPASVKGSGITMSVQDGKSGQAIRLGITADAQDEFFGGALDPAKDAVELILDDEIRIGHMGLRLADIGDEDAHELARGPRGAVSLRVIPWRKLAPGKRPAVSCRTVHLDKGKLVVVLLPEWAKPEPRKIGQGRSIMEA